MRTTNHFRSLRLAVTAVAASASLTGCGLFGSSWDIRMEVQGTGSATIAPRYAGDGDNLTGKPKLEQLPWSSSTNVGFGFNRLDVTGAAPGTTCKITADGKTIEEKPVDAQGNATCQANLQDD
jgi:hypothetical protein